MNRVNALEFSVESDGRFEKVTVFKTSINFKHASDDPSRPEMRIWTKDVDDDRALSEIFSELLDGQGELLERAPVEYAGLRGEFAKSRDHLGDFGDKSAPEWIRMRALLAAPDGTGWVHATALCTPQDLRGIEAAFRRMLGSIEVLLTGEAAAKARFVSREDIMAMVRERQKESQAREAEEPAPRREAEQPAKAQPVAEDVETRFDRALREAALSDRREALRKIAVPTLVLTETGPDDGTRLGLTRVGGGPDLPQAMEWPRDGSGFQYNFLVQVDLASLPMRPALPESGLLSFYIDTDVQEGVVLFIAPGEALVRHALPEDAEELTTTAHRMVSRDDASGRMKASPEAVDGLSAQVEADGRMRFLRGGAPVVALASEYEVCLTPQLLRIDPSLTVPSSQDPAYVEANLDDGYPFGEAVGRAMKVGDGPQHQMFGLLDADSQGEWSPVGRALKYARKHGWDDLADPQDWFLLMAVRSGGGADFCFWDYGDAVFMANAKDTSKGDFSRICAFVVSS